MVLFTMTPSIVDALEQLGEQRKTDEPSDETSSSTEPPAAGNPISHREIIRLHARLNASQSSAPKYSLEQLLQGSRTFQSRFPTAAHAFAEANKPSKAEDLGDDEVTYNEVHRQVTLIINFLVSIAGVAVALWIAGRWWSLSSRIFLSLGGSVVVAIAEVAVYSSYVWRMGEAKSKQGAVKEIREVVQTWVVGQEGDGQDESTPIRSKDEGDEQPGLHHLRKRDKPLRTYGRRTATPEAQSEPPSKRQRLSASGKPEEKSGPHPRGAHGVAKARPGDAAVTDAAGAKPEQDGSPRGQNEKKKREGPPRKGSTILSYFKPSQSQDSQPGEPVAPQPTPKPKQPTKRKPRLLKIKATTHEPSDQSSQEADGDGHAPRTRNSRRPLENAALGTAIIETTSSSTSPTPSPRRKSARNPRPSPNAKPSSPSIQTTLNISTQAPFSECKICDTVWNPLYPDDVKYHNRTHKAVLKAKKKKADDL
ncbi:atpase [Trichoderma cornu-damae]|uniref:Atpase n=1 Tax=Trichoderma cornu-damae TaxID=654480 RepID=A0A9P8QIC3_9HYPO|nr:atpase [Trichoderma cornu-damae]